MLNIPVIDQRLQKTDFPRQSQALLVYISAHWCPPCRGFTPLLKKFYTLAKDAGADVEIVFLSSDRSEKEMVGYYQESHGSWLAVPFFSPQRQFLSNHFNVKGIPALILVNRGTHQAVDLDVRSIVQQTAMMGSKDRVKQIVDEWRDRSGALMFESIPRSMSALTRDQREGAFEILAKIVSNIADHPTESKYRQLKGDNGTLKRSILDLSCGDAPLRAIGFFPDTSGSFNYRSSLCDAFTLKTILVNRESSGLCVLAAAAPLGVSSRPAPSVVPISTAVDVKFKIRFRDMHPQVIDAIPSSEPLDVIKAIAESVTDVQAEHQRLFCASLGDGALEGMTDTFRSAVELAIVKQPVIDLLVLSQHTRFNKYPIGEWSDEEANKWAGELRVKVLMLKSRFPEITQILSNLIHAQIYEVPSHQLKALQVVPVTELHRAAATVENSCYEERLFLELLSWFKHRFFKWTDKPACSACACKDTVLVDSSCAPSAEELKGLASRTEIYACSVCSEKTRFPRFNHPVALLATRQGRCGEWANCFTLIARSLGFEMRKVNDSADHVWTEVWMDHLAKWVHCDPCEEAYDKPLLYEDGWNKKSSFTVAVSKDGVVNVTSRYTNKGSSSSAHIEGISEANRVASEHWASLSGQPDRLQYLFKRGEEEKTEFEEFEKKNRQVSGLNGRTTGSLAWRKQRGEVGRRTEGDLIFSATHGGSHPDTVPFSDAFDESDSEKRISKISVWTDGGKLVSGIRTEWGDSKKQQHIGSRSARDSKPDFTLTLGQDESVSRVQIRVGDLLDYICIETTKGQTLQAGNESGGSEVKDDLDFFFGENDQSQLVGFHGGLGGHIHNLGVIRRKESDQQRIKKIFSKLVKDGQSANDAALEALRIVRSSK